MNENKAGLEKLCSAILFINSFIPSTSFMRSALMKLPYAISQIRKYGFAFKGKECLSG